MQFSNEIVQIKAASSEFPDFITSYHLERSVGLIQGGRGTRTRHDGAHEPLHVCSL